MKSNYVLFVPIAIIVGHLHFIVASNSKIIDPFEEGPYVVNSSTYYQLLNPSVDTNLNVYAPNEPGNFPVFYFVTGFAGEKGVSLQMTRWKLMISIDRPRTGIRVLDDVVKDCKSRLRGDRHMERGTAG